MELPNTEAMSVEEKIWFARAIAGMIVADGRVDDSELEFLKEAISFLEDRDQVNGIMTVVRQGKTLLLLSYHERIFFGKLLLFICITNKIIKKPKLMFKD